MKELVVISGKGGTGKTSIVASIAKLANEEKDCKPVFVDCDVDAADLHIILAPEIEQKNDFYSGKTAFINKDKCVECSKCQEICKFNAVKDFEIDKILCEGCGVCAKFCPTKAIEMKENLAGQWFVSNTRFGKFVHAKLGIAEENSGKLVTKIRNQARLVADQEKANLIIADGSPGIGCPVIASISGANLILIVTEPTKSGFHDLQRVYELTKHFKLDCNVCINKYDINKIVSKEIVNYCKENNIDVIAQILYDKDFSKAQINKKSIVEYSNNIASKEIKNMWQKLKTKLKEE